MLYARTRRSRHTRIRSFSLRIMPPRKSSRSGSSAKGAFAPWAQSPSAVASHFGLDPDRGLTASQVATQREKHGANELDKPEGKSLFALVLEQFDDALVKILLLAAVVSFALAFTEERAPGQDVSIVDFVEPGVILLILVLNAIVGVWQESNAESALEALKEMQSETARCLRDGEWIGDLPARELVPGDLVEIRTGDLVPADCRVFRLKTGALSLSQAGLTGESVSVAKTADAIEDHSVDCELQAKDCIVFSSTAVSQGAATCVVTETGMRTEIGKIQAQITEAADETEDTPLKQKLDDFGDQLTWFIGIICLLVWVMNYQFFVSWTWGGLARPFHFSDFTFDFSQCTYYFKIAVALAVAAIPEGLPAVITTCLALGTRKMAKKNAIVRHLQSVETLGCTSVICSDKTGTLTTNQMSATTVVVPGASDGAKLRVFDVEGTSYDPRDGGVIGLRTLDQSLAAVSLIGTMCNEASVAPVDPSDADQGFKCLGEPTEGALKVLAEKLGVDQDAEMSAIADARARDPIAGARAVSDSANARFEKVATLEFDRARKSMSVLARARGASAAEAKLAVRGTKKTAAKAKAADKNTLLVKGAPEHVLERCVAVLLPDGSEAPMSAATRKRVADATSAMSKQALRCLAFARKTEGLGDLASYDGSEAHPGRALVVDSNAYERVESGLTFCGLAGLRDPPRPEVPAAIAACKSAGIRVVVITGDNKLTAEAICADIGVLDPKGTAGASASFTGREFASMTRAQQAKVLSSPGGCVCSRAEPRHKQDIVRLLKEADEIVAMTGDGVNDAPALQMSDIGIAMGITGTSVAKQASDMVLADDNFSSIVDAISEGRSIYNNMKAFIRYMISSNVGEVVSIFLTAAAGMPEGLIPVQLLWVNLVTDGPPATALGFNPPDVDIMQKRPRAKNEDLISKWAMVRYLVVGLYVGFATVGVFAAWYCTENFLGLIDLSGDGHEAVTWYQLTHWSECETWSEKDFRGGQYTTVAGDSFAFTGADRCAYFGAEGKRKASTLSLTVLVAIEMFNACNAVSEDISLFVMPPWINPWLLLAMFASFALHFVILYVPALATIFSIVPLDANEWALVMAFSTPVWIIDEALKWIGRNVFKTGR